MVAAALLGLSTPIVKENHLNQSIMTSGSMLIFGVRAYSYIVFGLVNLYWEVENRMDFFIHLLLGNRSRQGVSRMYICTLYNVCIAKKTTSIQRYGLGVGRRKTSSVADFRAEKKRLLLFLLTCLFCNPKYI